MPLKVRFFKKHGFKCFVRKPNSFTPTIHDPHEKTLMCWRERKKLFLSFSLHSCQASLQPFIWHKSYIIALSFVFSPLLLLQLTAAIVFLSFGIVVSSVCLVIDGLCIALNMVRYLHLLVTSADGCTVN